MAVLTNGTAVETAPLSAPKNNDQTHTLSLVILIVAIFSALGSIWMILGFAMNKSLRTFRHQLILGLALSDFFMAINFLSSAAVNLSGQDIGSKSCKSFCSFNGFMIQTFVDQTDYWVLSIAACIFIMVDDRKAVSQWIQNNRVVVWTVPWALSLLWATLGLCLAGYGDIGAWCWFTSDKTRLLVNFLPRWVIIVLMLLLYLRLHFIIHRAHDNFVSFNDDEEYGVGSGSHSGPYSVSKSGGSWSLQPVHMSELSEGSSQERIVAPPAPPAEAPRPKTRRSRGAADLRRLSYQMMLYPLVYMLIWALPTAIRIYQAVSGHSAPFSVATVDKVRPLKKSQC
ncbi:Glucose receptor Git3 [Cordyceps fumosorosea ARSEF 2679]|uniref:Glucose receptor Git3 n=1 Tax=Cordyceps fumosorosea (strain ARSEF 2679) TaxID=1081104 RepID=A0A167RLN7_CORFA|nr:Glucose receptor Git3 [Cordyceps fumosorosea ARSEF 2679]OAA58719.1 Glucose receptor Git3 [Cordyceps fumosorosea ARSEF 2679]